jgi:hypothetical protein
VALEIKIMGVLEKQKEIWVEEPGAGWSTRELAEDPRLRSVERNPAYRDWVATFTVDEALKLADEYAPKAMPWQRARADQLRVNIQKSTWIILSIFEWD